jgi:hypothetical protein
MYEGIIVMEISNFKDMYLAELQEHTLYDPRGVFPPASTVG